jgi:hypothetical protein
MSLRGEIAVALTLGGAITIAIVAGRSTRALAPNDEPASTYRAGPAGSKGVFDVLVRLGRTVARRRTSLFSLATNPHARPALLVVNAPVEDLGVGDLLQTAR